MISGFEHLPGAVDSYLQDDISHEDMLVALGGSVDIVRDASGLAIGYDGWIRERDVLVMEGNAVSLNRAHRIEEALGITCIIDGK